MTSATFSSRVEAALAAVDEAAYTTNPDGSRLRQSSAPSIIAVMLDLLDVHPGQRVLEIGTGSGYSTALLTELTGPTGHVTSIDIDPTLTARAKRLLATDGRHNVVLVAGDGRDGTPTEGDSFDRVIAWATVEHIPHAWTARAAPDALIVAPVDLTEAAKTHAVVRARRTDTEPGLVGETVTAGGFVEAHDQILHQWLIPPRGVDALLHDAHGRPWWLSTPRLRTDHGRRLGGDLLQQLIDDADIAPGPLTDGEDDTGFSAYLLAARPEGLTTAALGDPAWRIGCTTPAGAAFVSTTDGRQAVHTGDADALEHLHDWAEDWRRIGRPGHADLRPELTRAEDGWTVRAALRKEVTP